MAERVCVADILQMAIDCGPGSKARVASHCILITLNRKKTKVPKGPGKPKGAEPKHLRGVMVGRVYARKVAQQLDLPRDCVEQWFPGLLGDA